MAICIAMAFFVSPQQAVAAPADGDLLTNTAILDYDSAPPGGVVATVDFEYDNPPIGAPPTDITFTCTIEPSCTGMYVYEDDVARVLGTLATVDADQASGHNYTIDDPRFEATGNQLQLASGAVLDHETEPAINIVITTEDSNGNTFAKAFVVSVLDVDEGPVPGASSLSLLAPNDAGSAFDVAESACEAQSSNASTFGYTIPDLPGAVTLGDADAYAIGDPIFISVDDADQNVAPGAIDTVEVVVEASLTSDSETVILSETGNNSGVFVGYLFTTSQEGDVEDCGLTVRSGTEVTVTYTDPTDGSDLSASAADVAPAGLVFNDETGEPINGVVLTLVRVDTGTPAGTPANVRGDGPDFAVYPSVVKSGETTRDGAGNTYDAEVGEYRFPAIPNGEYRIEIFNSVGFQASTRDDDDLQDLGGSSSALTNTSEGTFVLSDASRGQTFTVSQGALPRIDIPIRVLPPKPNPTPSSIEFLQYSGNPSVGQTVNVQQTFCVAGQTRQVSELRGEVLPVPGIVNLVPTDTIKAGQPVFVRVTDQDQNDDSSVRERITIELNVDASGDREYLELTETEPNSAVFVGYIQTTEGDTSVGSCNLGVVKDRPITTTYTDAFDNSDTAESRVLVDPFGLVFSTHDGAAIDGVTVTLVNADTGAPADVFGDGPDFAEYPSTVVTGGEVTDAAGNVYDFPAGEYRFPFVAPGNYRLELTDIPSGYIYPSETSTDAIQELPDAPYAIADGSRGEDFVVPVGPALHIDIPIDEPSADIFVSKEASKSTAAIGDFIQYRIGLENSEGSLPRDTVLVDTLPKGFRYQKGSLRIGGEPAGDPEIGANGRELSIPLPRSESATLEVRYVTEITVGAMEGVAINEATVVGELVESSNTASARVTVTEELFRNSAILVGQVAVGECGEPGGEPLEGVRIFLEDGTYITTDENGSWHIEGVKPGTHIVQMDVDSLAKRYEPAECNRNARFAGSPHSQFVDVKGGTVWRADFKVQQKPDPVTDIELTQNVRVSKRGLDVTTLVETDGPVEVTDANIIYREPKGWKIANGSASLDGEPIPYSETIVGSVFRIAKLRDRHELKFSLKPVPPPAPGPEANRLYEFNPGFETRSAELQEADKRKLDGLIREWSKGSWKEIMVVGHTDSIPIASSNKSQYMSNTALSEARAIAVAGYVRERLDVPIAMFGGGDRYPVADNSSPEGRIRNRRVEFLLKAAPPKLDREALLAGESSVRLTFSSSGSTKGKSDANTLPLEKVDSDFRQLSTAVKAKAIGSWDEVEATATIEVAQRDPTVQGLISVVDGTRLVNSTNAVKLDLDSRLKPRLRLDGEVVPNDRIGFRAEDESTGKTLYSYIGVEFGEPGRHTLVLEGVDGFGNVRYEETAEVVRVGELYSVRVIPVEDNIADGQTPVRVQLELLDRSGEKIETDYKLRYQSDQLRAYQRDKDLSELSMIPDGDLVDVRQDGMVRFEPVSQSGVYHVQLMYKDYLEKDVDVFVAPEERDWIMVGLAEGTAGYNTLSGNMEGLEAEGIEDELSADGRVAFYAKGKVKGEFIMTMAYDTAKEVDRSQLGQAIDPDRYYTLYGDRTATQYGAPSQEKLYLKLEKGHFYFLFGDYETGLAVTELSRYARSLSGVKTEYQNERFDVTAFASEADQAFVKDEIRGDGTSGIYRLSTRNILVNSESVTIETHDRFQSQEIIESREMRRHVDYNIDYDEGTIFFKEPIYSQDFAFNPNFIVVDYEVRGDGKDRLNAGGRVAYKPTSNTVIGVTAVREGTQNREGELGGIDVRVELDEVTEFRAEAATTRNKTDAGDVDGSAYLAEITRRSQNLDAKAYVREQESEFGLGQQRSSESGTRKMGGDATYHLTDDVEVVAEAYRQRQLSTGDTEDVASTTVEMGMGSLTGRTGVRSATANAAGVRRTSNQILAGGNYRMMDGKLVVGTNVEAPIGGSGDAPDFPKRLRVGLDYELTDGVRLKAEQEFSWGEAQDSQGTRVGLASELWKGAEFTSSLEQDDQENSERLAAVTGLKQRVEIGNQWTVDFGVDRSQTIKDSTSTPPDLQVTTVYSSPDDDDFTSVTFGSRFRKDAWDWTTRMEYRTADSGDKVNILSDVIHDLDDGQQLLASVDLQTEEGDEAERVETGVQLGYAYRPFDSRWTILNRLDLLHSRRESIAFDALTQKIVNNLNANYMVSDTTQLALQYGAKYVVDNFDDDQYSGFTDLYGMEIRHDVNEKWDVGVQGSTYKSWESGVSDSSYGVSVGYNMARNVWMSLGYNFVGFRDDDFNASEYTAKGIYLKYRVKFDQYTARSFLDAIE